MVNEIIIEGLRSALMRGESLRQAMISFANAGYNRNEIEEAARFLQTGQPIIQQPVVWQQKVIQQPVSAKPLQAVSQHQLPMQTRPLPTLSSSQHPKTNLRTKLIIIVMILIFLFLMGMLTGFFLFKENLIEFFDTLM